MMNKYIGGLFPPLAFAAPAFAWDGVSSGKASTLEVTENENYGLRVMITPVASMCPEAYMGLSPGRR